VRILVLAWDVARPGVLDPAAQDLAAALVAAGAEVHVVASGAGLTATRRIGDVGVTWVAEAPPVLPDERTYDLSRVIAFASRADAAVGRFTRTHDIDVLIAWGWQTTYTAANLRSLRGVPIVAFLDDLEFDRHGEALPDDHAKLVHQVEWWLTFEARRVVASTEHVRRGLLRAFRLPPEKVDVVPHGVAPPGVAITPRAGVGIVAPAGSRAAAQAATRLGRSGIPVALAGPPRPRARNVVAATADEATARAVVVVLDHTADAVALAALVRGRAVVVPEAGRLRELVHARRTGMRVDPDDADAIVRIVDVLHGDERLRQRLGERGAAEITRRRAWPGVAADVLDVCRRAIGEEAALIGHETADRHLRPVLLRSPLLDLDNPD
jgi:glycogen synthase